MVGAAFSELRLVSTVDIYNGGGVSTNRVDEKNAPRVALFFARALWEIRFN